MNKDKFIEELNKINLFPTADQLIKLEKYYKILMFWNEKINLTSLTNEEEVYLKHFYDSLTLSLAIDLNKDMLVCDVGTGAGFPGVVLKIFFSNLNIVLVDSLNKRTSFLKAVIEELKLDKIEVITDRAEHHIRMNLEKYDLITCRAVSKLNVISEVCLPGVKIGGYFIPMKANIEEEIKDIKYLELLGGKLEKILTFTLPIELSIRNLIKIKKEKESNKNYPREYNKIKNYPLL